MEVMEDLNMAIRCGDVKSFTERLAEVEELSPGVESTGRILTVSGSLCYAAETGFIPIMDTLIEKGVGKVLLLAEQH